MRARQHDVGIGVVRLALDQTPGVLGGPAKIARLEQSGSLRKRLVGWLLDWRSTPEESPECVAQHIRR
jgi:hypothetical protein